LAIPAVAQARRSRRRRAVRPSPRSAAVALRRSAEIRDQSLRVLGCNPGAAAIFAAPARGAGSRAPRTLPAIARRGRCGRLWSRRRCSVAPGFGRRRRRRRAPAGGASARRRLSSGGLSPRRDGSGQVEDAIDAAVVLSRVALLQRRGSNGRHSRHTHRQADVGSRGPGADPERGRRDPAELPTARRGRGSAEEVTPE
jgi:hypothetical protein